MRFRHLVWLVAALAACRPADRTGPISVVDGQNRRVSVAHPAQRIVSLAPATSELVFAIGAGSRLVGRTRWCDYPPEVTGVTSVGDGLNPNVEAVAAQTPDLVAMYSTAGNDPAVAQLARLNIPAVNLPMDRLSDVSRSARMLGRLVGDSARADSVAARFDSTLAALEAARPTGGPRVVMVVWDNPPMVIGAGSFMTEMVVLAGGTNVFADASQPSITVSIETIAARNPDLMLISGEDGSVPAWATRPEWKAVRAVRERRFAYMHGSEFHRPSLRAPDAVKHLAVILKAVNVPPLPYGRGGQGVR